MRFLAGAVAVAGFKLQLGIAVCLLAGCATQPTAPAVQPSRALALPAAHPLRLRIGIEHLPPEDTGGDDPVMADALRAEPQTHPAVAHPELAPGSRRNDPVRRRNGPVLRELRPLHTWAMTETDLAELDDPIARETLRFVEDLIAADRKRVEFEAGIPFLDWREVPTDRGPLLASEQMLADLQEEWVHEHGPALLKAPLKKMLRRLPLIQDFEVALDEFRSDNVPLSEPYCEQHDEGCDLGRLSMRLHAGDLRDPVEIAYIWGGFRLASSQEHAKLALDLPLADRLRLRFHTRSDYQDRSYRVRADLIYSPTRSTTLHLAAGDDMDFLATSSIYSMFDTPMDGTNGLVLYAVHTF